MRYFSPVVVTWGERYPVGKSPGRFDAASRIAYCYPHWVAFWVKLWQRLISLWFVTVLSPTKLEMLLSREWDRGRNDGYAEGCGQAIQIYSSELAKSKAEGALPDVNP